MMALYERRSSAKVRCLTWLPANVGREKIEDGVLHHRLRVGLKVRDTP